MKTKIRNPDRMKQLVDFTGLELDGGIYPTDIDGLIEYHDKEYILLEIKYGETKVPIGQRLAMERMVNDFTKLGKPSVAIVGEHRIADVGENIVAAECVVREIYYGGEQQWRKTDKQMTIKEFIDNFQAFVVDKGGV